MKTTHYIVTLREATIVNEEATASQAGVDLLLDVTPRGGLFFPDELFQEAKVMLRDSREKATEAE
jgi:hypothetical protein